MALENATKYDHILMFAYSFFGHQKPLCDLAVKIVRFRRVHVTILVGDTLYDKLHKQVFGQINAATEGHLQSLIRIVGINSAESGFDSKSTNKAFAATFEDVFYQRPIRRRPVLIDDVLPSLPSPNLVILDLLSYEAFRIVRSIGGTKIRVFALQPSQAAQVFLMSAPKQLGGRGDFAAELDNEAEAIDVDSEGIIKFAQQLWERTDGRLIGGAGLPQMYDYEVYPQVSVFGDNVSIAYIARYMHRLFNECDGIILNTSQFVESHAISAWKEWLSPRPVFSLGPLAPPVESIELHNEDESSALRDVTEFLETALDRYGENSVVYISFGTVFWTTEPEKVWAIFDVLLDLKIPFIFAHASPVASIPDDVRAKATASGLAYLSKWVPQHFVLHHRVTGWFLSHCGQNSTMESLMEGVPMICWPFRGDQPCNAINLTVNLNVAYELFDVRNGELGLSPIRRLGNRAPAGTIDAVRREAREVFTKAIGEDGASKRKNVLRIKEQIAKSWENDGVCQKELMRLLEFLHI